ncbi:hypothetical protein RD792_012150 [Penstemon davidsonii]|uniref:Non-specific lipid-transfer protein n=1 Tax=Penstemon davidsonii TaxID=160366 RepID=A0ABR0CXK3_9LAMI|nr:hypothetical protein RD792_012150 [Penstemon davidsonii]
MAKSMCSIVMLAVIIAVVSVAPPRSEAAISCNTVANALSPCVNYVVYGGVAPPAECCNGARSLYAQVRSTPDRQAVCSCVKSVASSATPAMISNAAALPGKCGISIPYQISPSTDCSKIQ